MLRSGSPAMKPFEQPMTWDELGQTRSTDSVAGSASATMTVAGTVSKTFINLSFAGVGALVVWALFSRQIISVGFGLPMCLGLIALSWIGTMVINSKPHTAKVLGPILSTGEGAWAAFASYAVASMVKAQVMARPELVGHAGPFVDTTGATAEAQAAAVAAGIIFQAMLLTLGVVGAITIATGTGILRVGGTAKKVIIGATGALMFVYIASMVMRLIGVPVPFIHSTGPVGIGFSVVVVILASLNLAMVMSSVMDGVAAKLPKHYEWVAGHAIIATVIWLYVEILRLLYKIFASRE